MIYSFITYLFSRKMSAEQRQAGQRIKNVIKILLINPSKAAEDGLTCVTYWGQGNVEDDFPMKLKITNGSLSPQIFSFFSGAGFLDLGFESEGFTVAFVNEVHGPFLDAYKFSRSKLGINPPQYGYHNCSIHEFLQSHSNILEKYVDDCRQGNRLVGFVGGPPCPDFSVGGKNRGEHGENGQLSQTYIDIICEQLPDFFIFENVKGLYRTKRHKDFFNRLKAQLTTHNYSCFERLINAIEYGVPQDRERIILFGCHKSKLDKNSTTFDWISETIYPNREAFSFSWPQRGEAASHVIPDNVPAELTVQHWFDKNNVMSHPNAENHFKPRAGLQKFLTLQEGDDSKKSYKRLHRWRYSPTAAYGNNEVHVHPCLPRRISASEALAIQSLPKEFELPNDMTLSNMFKTIGNGVPYLAAKGVAKSVMNFLRNNLS